MCGKQREVKKTAGVFFGVCPHCTQTTEESRDYLLTNRVLFSLRLHLSPHHPTHPIPPHHRRGCPITHILEALQKVARTHLLYGQISLISQGHLVQLKHVCDAPSAKRALSGVIYKPKMRGLPRFHHKENSSSMLTPKTILLIPISASWFTWQKTKDRLKLKCWWINPFGICADENVLITILMHKATMPRMY